MKKLKLTNILLITVAAQLLVGLLGHVLLSRWLPEHYFAAYPAVVGFFVFLALVYFLFLSVSPKLRQRTHALLLFAIKGARFFLSLLFIGILFYLDRAHMFQIMIVFMAFYLIFLLVEGMFLTHISLNEQ